MKKRKNTLIQALINSGCKLMFKDGKSLVFDLRCENCPDFYNWAPKLFPFCVIENGKYIDCFYTFADAVLFTTEK